MKYYSPILFLCLLFVSCTIFYPSRDGTADISFVLGSAQYPRISIRGQIVDIKNGEPLIGAIVEIIGLRKTETDLDGNYSFVDIPHGNYTIKIDYIGYKPYQIKGITLGGDSFAVVNIKLAEIYLEIDPV